MLVRDILGEAGIGAELAHAHRYGEQEIKRAIRRLKTQLVHDDLSDRDVQRLQHKLRMMKKLLHREWAQPSGGGLGAPGAVSEDEECDCEYEKVYVDENDNILTEAAIRQFKRIGDRVKIRYRCLSGPKQGKLVAEPGKCGTRKDPKKVRQGRKVMRAKKGTIKRKAKVAKRRQISKMVARMNKRLAGKGT